MTQETKAPGNPASPAPSYRAVGPTVVVTRYGLGGRVPYETVVAETPDWYASVALADWLNKPYPVAGRKVA